MKYRKKPVVIEAFQWMGEEVPGFKRSCDRTGNYYLEIPTLEGVMRADIGDFIITGVKNEVYPCKPDVFALTYEEV